MPSTLEMASAIVAVVVLCITVLVIFGKAPAEWAYNIYMMVLGAVLGAAATYFHQQAKSSKG